MFKSKKLSQQTKNEGNFQRKKKASIEMQKLKKKKKISQKKRKETWESENEDGRATFKNIIDNLRFLLIIARVPLGFLILSSLFHLLYLLIVCK